MSIPPNILIEVDDDWCGNYSLSPFPAKYVCLNISPHRHPTKEGELHSNGLWQLCIWGTDDKGVKIDGSEDYIWTKYYDVIITAAVKPLNYQWFLDMDFEPA